MKFRERLLSVHVMICMLFRVAGLGGEPVTNGHIQVDVTGKPRSARYCSQVYTVMNKSIKTFHTILSVRVLFYHVSAMGNTIYSSSAPDTLGLYQMISYSLTCIEQTGSGFLRVLTSSCPQMINLQYKMNRNSFPCNSFPWTASHASSPPLYFWIQDQKQLLNTS